ncbi:MAG: hypothetical protein NTZ74_16205 [Chloroflexi bacterium]|nr:hypothetical protein [Chloroflexota bacterium]
MSTPTLSTVKERTRKITRVVEFDYVTWTLNALQLKLEQTGVNPTQLLSPLQQQVMVLRYFELTRQLEEVQTRIQFIFSDPTVKDPAKSAISDLVLQRDLQSSLKGLAPIAESILEGQVSDVIVAMGIPRTGEVLPPVLFRTSPLPKALIVSPRDKIQQEINLSLLADLSLEQMTVMERKVESATHLSALVVDVGGIGVYPTMVMRSSNLKWVIEVIAHEWTHNYLTLRPLGLHYEGSSELRTMNETTASIAGKEIGSEVIRRYYPEYAVNEFGENQLAFQSHDDPPFEFNVEMHQTRMRVDELLSQRKVDEAEQYMEKRRVFFVNHGYMIRRLNQAYFAFYGAYADQPGGASGQDPVGPAVRALRTQSNSLTTFLRRISVMNSFEDLQAAVKLP